MCIRDSLYCALDGVVVGHLVGIAVGGDGFGEGRCAALRGGLVGILEVAVRLVVVAYRGPVGGGELERGVLADDAAAVDRLGVPASCILVGVLEVAVCGVVVADGGPARGGEGE